MCKPGEHCNTDECKCWAKERSCNPDLCRYDACILPSKIEFNSRNCRNVGILTGNHKLTFIGKSPVLGFGLFAGEVFDGGDLIGIFAGGIMDWREEEKRGHLYDAKDHTFSFDVTQELVIDAGMLGLKVKFINHTGDEREEIAEARCVRVRGEARLGLFAQRRVEVGAEFMFNYKLQNAPPEWA